MRFDRNQAARERLDVQLGEAGRKAVCGDATANAIYQVAIRAMMPLIGYPHHIHADDYADIHDMDNWAQSIMESREPDFLLKDGANELYMKRWFVIPRNEFVNVYLHHAVRSDKDVPHDHPWDNTSLLIRGCYIEHGLNGEAIIRMPGDVVQRKAEDAHRLELYEGGSSVSLFITGPKRRDWGFHCPNGWVPWQEFTGGDHAGRGDTGRGCGES